MVFKHFMRLEINRCFNRRKAVILILFFIFTAYFIQSGIYQYKKSYEEIKRFQEFEEARIKNFQYYAQYGTYGFRLLYIPEPFSSIFTNAGIVSQNLHAFI